MKFLKKNENMSSLLRKRYIIALSIIAFLLVFSQIAIQTTIRNQKDDARVINIAGRQRMLSQKIAKESYNLYFSIEKDGVKTNNNELKESLELFKTSHYGLQYGDGKLNLPNKNSQTVKKLFTEIEPFYKNIINASNDILEITSSNNVSKEDLFEKVMLIKNNEDKFLNIMDIIVFTYDSESQQKVNNIRYMELILFLITIFTLLMELLFIFKPAEKQITQAFKEIEKSHENLLKLFETAPTAMFLLDEESLDIMQLNKQAEELVGIKDNNSNMLKLENIIENEADKNIDIISEIKNKDKLKNEEAFLYDAKKDQIVVLLSSNKIYFFDKLAILLGIADITKQKQAEVILKRYATFDEMTGLLNKRAGLLYLENYFELAKNGHQDLTVSFIDVDGLKGINDTYGHKEGDWYIKKVAESILSSLHANECAFRYGGDEIVLALSTFDANQTEKLMASIQNKLTSIVEQFKKPYKMSISWGICNIKSYSASDVSKLIAKADQIMYENKRRKKAQ